MAVRLAIEEFHECSSMREITETLMEALKGLNYSRGLLAQVDYEKRRVVSRRKLSWGGKKMQDLAAKTNRRFRKYEGDCQIRAVYEGKPQVILDPTGDMRADREAIELADLKPFAVFPLLDSRGKTRWTVHVEREDTAPLGKSDVALTEYLCRQAMIAWERIRRASMERHWAELVAEKTFDTAGSLLGAYAEFVVQVGLALRCRVYTIGDDGYQHGLQQAGRNQAKRFGSFLLPGDETPLQSLMATMRPVIVRRASTPPVTHSPHGEYSTLTSTPDPGDERRLGKDGVAQWVEAPVVRRGKIEAKIVFDNHGEGEVPLADIRIIDATARLLSTAYSSLATQAVRFRLARAGLINSVLRHHVKLFVARMLSLPGLPEATRELRMREVLDSLTLLGKVCNPYDTGPSGARRQLVTVTSEMELARTLVKPLGEGTLNIDWNMVESKCMVPEEGHPLCLVLLSLIANAIMAVRKVTDEGMPVTGKISVKLLPDSSRLRCVTIDVSDWGCGISPETANRVRAGEPVGGEFGEGVSLAYSMRLAEDSKWSLRLLRRRHPTKFRLQLHSAR
ncbi:MAG: sensor histidine kinase [Verrucomicrobia bacterium]|nr:sensor histidine kinase [Verrucomicrobiota bacterium]